jgi:hypothetical protein
MDARELTASNPFSKGLYVYTDVSRGLFGRPKTFYRLRLLLRRVKNGDRLLDFDHGTFRHDEGHALPSSVIFDVVALSRSHTFKCPGVERFPNSIW